MKRRFLVFCGVLLLPPVFIMTAWVRALISKGIYLPGFWSYATFAVSFCVTMWLSLRGGTSARSRLLYLAGAAFVLSCELVGFLLLLSRMYGAPK
jgi:hypothetical protein